MSGIREYNLQANSDTDREHQVQLELLHKLCQAVDVGTDAAGLNDMLGELTAYSEAHFASEELLMRMKSYDDFEAHQEDHFQMLEVLRTMSEQASAGQVPLVAGKARAALHFLEQHIATRDSRLTDYVRHNL
jgi:hemerythrin